MISIFDLITAVLVAALALFLISFMLAAVWSGLRGAGVKIPKLSLNSLEAMRESAQFRMFPNSLSKIDARIEGGQFDEAVQECRGALFLEAIRKDRVLLDRVDAHHDEVLSRLIIISNLMEINSNHVPLMEDLLASRAELLKALIDASSTLENFKSKVRGDRRGSPSWAINQYEKQVSEILDRLNTNKRSILGVMAEFQQELLKITKAPSESVTYH